MKAKKESSTGKKRTSSKIEDSSRSRGEEDKSLFFRSLFINVHEEGSSLVWRSGRFGGAPKEWHTSYRCY